jgi:hypothetical protein
MDRIEGKTLYWAKQDGNSDPEGALQRHLELNDPPMNFHLVGYHKDGKMVPLTRTAFQKQIWEVTIALGLPHLKGHSIRIGSTGEYLKRGLPFEVAKVKGRWKSDAFHQYIRDHTKVLAPYMQSVPPDTHDRFIHIAIPSARG